MVEGRDIRIGKVAEALRELNGRREGGGPERYVIGLTVVDEVAAKAVDALTSDFDELELLEKQSAQMHRYFEQRFHEVSARLAKAEAALRSFPCTCRYYGDGDYGVCTRCVGLGGVTEPVR